MNASQIARFRRGSLRGDETGLIRTIMDSPNSIPTSPPGRPQFDQNINPMTLGNRTGYNAISQFPKTIINETSGRSGYQSS